MKSRLTNEKSFDKCTYYNCCRAYFFQKFSCGMPQMWSPLTYTLIHTHAHTHSLGSAVSNQVNTPNDLEGFFGGGGGGAMSHTFSSEALNIRRKTLQMSGRLCVCVCERERRVSVCVCVCVRSCVCECTSDARLCKCAVYCVSVCVYECVCVYVSYQAQDSANAR